MKYRFALIGCGKIGPRHAGYIAEMAELAAVCDTDPEKADLLARQYNCRAYYSLDELLAAETALEVASICTPNYLHAGQSIQCLRRGLHVLCEKPMTINISDGHAMIEAARKAQRKLFIVKQNRFNPPVVAVKKLLDRNGLGRIHAFQVNCFWNRDSAYYQSPWKGRVALDGGLLFTQFSHFIDLLGWFLGDAAAATCLRTNFLLKNVTEIEDTGFAIIQMANGAIGSLNYTVTSFSKNMEGSFSLFGDKGTVKIGGEYLNTLEYFCVRNEDLPHIPVTGQANDYGFYQGSMSNHDAVYTNLIRALNNTDHTVVEGIDALKTVEIIEKIYQSAAPFN